MTDKLAAALALASRGFWVFPILPWPIGDSPGKTPAVKFKEWSTRDPEKIKAQWTARPDCNIGIYTAKYGESEALLVVDVDMKGNKNGDAALIDLQLETKERLPETLEASTPTGGRHLFFRVETAVRQGANVLGQGLDTRSRGGFVVGAGSTISENSYGWRRDAVLAPAPAWLIDRCGTVIRDRNGRSPAPGIHVDSERAASRARAYLGTDAPIAIDGAGGNSVTFKVACKVKDLGCDADVAFDIMAEVWNPRCQGPWDHEDLRKIVDNAFGYGFEAQGANAPEAQFTVVPSDTLPATDNADPRDPKVLTTLGQCAELNEQFAFTMSGGAHILWEWTNPKGRREVRHVTIDDFNAKFAAREVMTGNKLEPLTKSWMKWSGRRSYDAIVFLPEQEPPPNCYNLWRGFTVEPLAMGVAPTSEAKAACSDLFDHMLKNVCMSDATLFNWLWSYFAHLAQRPWEKPLTALVFRGRKGVGKSIVVKIIGHLLGPHYLSVANQRYLGSQFNAHLENCLLLALEEAVWGGDKNVEGILKDLITGDEHVIERKRQEVYRVDNKTRVVLIGNEDWIVPASEDERRYAVFDVGEGRRQDTDYFEKMLAGMDAGGYALLLRTLRTHDLSNFKVNKAPNTDGLLGQKLATFDTLQRWWFESLSQGRLVSSDFGGEWPLEIACDRFRGSLARYAKDNNMKSWMPSEEAVGRLMKKAVPGWRRRQTRTQGWLYILPPLDTCRENFCAYIGQSISWEPVEVSI